MLLTAQAAAAIVAAEGNPLDIRRFSTIVGSAAAAAWVVGTGRIGEHEEVAHYDETAESNKKWSYIEDRH